jgi:plastocyanin
VYRWWVYLHLLGVFGFLISHGVSVAVTFRLRKERDPSKVQALLGMSSASLTGFYPSMVLLIAGGVAAGYQGNWWGYGWIWWSIGLLALVTVAMYAMAKPHFSRIRFVTDAMVGGSKAVSPEEYGEALSAPRGLVIAGIGFAGLAVILFLMLFKPDLGMAPDTPEAPEGPPAASLTSTELAFDTDSLSVPAGREFGLEFENRSSLPHNVAIRDSDGEGLFTGETFTGPRTVTYGVPALEPGSYTFVCDVHPEQMTGTLEVT